MSDISEVNRVHTRVFPASVLTVCPDFNTPGVWLGNRASSGIKSEWLLEDFRRGEIKVGDPVVGYFDPDGNSGWSVTGVIVKLEEKPSRITGEPVLFVWADYSESS